MSRTRVRLDRRFLKRRTYPSRRQRIADLMVLVMAIILVALILLIVTSSDYHH